VILGVGLALVALMVAVGFVGFSVWVEDRFPSTDPERALLPTAQQAMTRPIVSAISRQIERRVRSRAEALYMVTGLTLEETIARFLDESVDLAQRRLYAYRLARVGSPECVAALLKVFQTAPPEHKAAMAQLIGSTGNPAAKEWLWPLLEDGDKRVVKAGIRGLSAIGGDDVTARISRVLADARYEEPIRIEAALGLGTIGTPGARDALTEAFNQRPSSELATQILNSLGQFEYPTVAETFDQYLAARETPRAMRVVAVEALAGSSSEAVPFLLGVAERDADTDVRASAAWAISSHETVSDLGPALADMAEREPAADVRRRLYEALLAQADIPAERLLPRVRAERDIEARVAGFNAVGLGARHQPDSALASAFDQEIVPELLRIATAPNSVNIQLRAVFALRRADTTAAQAALAMIANNARPQVATAARNGLRATGG
jgi:HEAT repeat protein